MAESGARAAACDIVFLAPTRVGDVLEARAAERHRGARRGVYDVTVSRLNEGRADVVAEFRGISQSTKDPVLGRTTKSLTWGLSGRSDGG